MFAPQAAKAESDPPINPTAAFATLFDQLLRAGRRPAPADSEPWTSAAFARTQPCRGDAAGVLPRTVANWRKGRSLPYQIDPILRALFGPLRNDGGSEREALHAAYLAAREPLDREALRRAKPNPVGEIFVVAGDQLAIDRNPSPDDVEVAATPAVAAQHAEALRLAERLAPMIRRRGNSLSAAWDDLLPTVERFLAAIQRPTAELPGVLAAMFQASVGMGGLVQQDDQLRAHREDGESPLPVDLRRVLLETVTASVLLSRAFPSNTLRDGILRDFWRPEAMPDARQVVADAKNEDVIEQRDVASLDEMIADAARAGTQGEKSKGRLFATLRNVILTGASAIMLSGIANESELVKRLSKFMVRAERPILAVMDGAPVDTLIAVRNTLERASKQPTEEHPSMPFGGAAASPSFREPPPDFDIDEVKRMVLAGRTPPQAWVPYITDLSLMGEPLRDLDPLRGLSSLKSLFLSGTQVTVLEPLRGLTSLETLWLDGARVSDLDPLRDLGRLQTLLLDDTKVGDLGPLRGLDKLHTLWLNQTKVSNLDPLRKLTSLESLMLDGTNVQNLDPLRELTSLDMLSLNDTEIIDLDPLRGLTKMQRLSLARTQVNDLDPLRSFTKPYVLMLSGTAISNLDPLRDLTSLQQLFLEGTKVEDLEPLNRLNGLETLWLQGTRIRDLAPLAGLRTLRDLRFSSKRVRSLLPLAALQELVALDCGDSPITDVAPLLGLSKLRVLRVRAEARNGGADLQSIAFTSGIERLFSVTRDHTVGASAAAGGKYFYTNGTDFHEHAARALVQAHHSKRASPT
jgi:Leucine-rich repeat (LRR) protein